MPQKLARNGINRVNKAKDISQGTPSPSNTLILEVAVGTVGTTKIVSVSRIRREVGCCRNWECSG